MSIHASIDEWICLILWGNILLMR